MSSATTYARLRDLRAPVITTGEAAAALRVGKSAASRSLRTLAAHGLVRRVRRGLWSVVDTPLDPRQLIGELTRPYPAYVSFQSALATRGAIDEVPREITVATLAKPRRIATYFGTFALHRLPPELFGGFTEERGVALASVEKAVFDSCYIACASGHPSRRLPDLDLPSGFRREEIESWIDRVPSARLRTLVEAAVRRALAHAEYEDPLPARSAPRRPRSLSWRSPRTSRASR